MKSVMACGLLICASLAIAEGSPPVTALTLHNRSSYTMINAVWTNGSNCTERLNAESPLNINGDAAPVVTLPSERPVAVGIAIFDAKGKTPVVCDYILSFTLSRNHRYRLDFDVHDRRCFGQLFRQEDSGNYQLVTSESPENLQERFPEFGWDQFEPGCSAP